MAKKSKPKSKKLNIKPGDIVVFEPKNFNPEFWNNLSEKDRKKYYGPLGYGAPKIKLFVFVSPVNCLMGNKVRDSGHCILLDLDDGHLEYMRHTSEFRHATEEEW